MRSLFKKLYNFLTFLNFYITTRKYKKIIFLHPPQSAGNSTEYFFKLNFGFRHARVETNNPNITNINLHDSKYKDYFINSGHFGADIAFKNGINKDYFYLFNIRKPRNRYLSNYYRNKRVFQESGRKYFTLEEFLLDNLNRSLDNLYVRYLSGESIYKSEVGSVDESIFNKALENLNKLNFIFIVDNSQNDFKLLSKKLKIFLPLSKLFQLQKNKVSDSKYPILNKKEEELLNKLIFFDNKIYEKVILKNK